MQASDNTRSVPPSPGFPRRGDTFQQLVPVDHLRVGVFVRLELKWYEHPFLFSSFKIKNRDQIQIIKDLGLSHVICIPSKSDSQPAAPRWKPFWSEPRPAAADSDQSKPDQLWEIKKERIRRVRERNRNIQRCKKQYDLTSNRVNKLMQNLLAGSEEAAEEGSLLIHDMVESLLAEREIVVHLMNAKGKDDGLFYHTLNVAILSLLIGKEYGMKAETLEELGLGALFHDIGKHRIPKKVTHKRTPLTPAEREFIRLHPKYGEEMISRIKCFPDESRTVIRQHHESVDGRGYPDGLRDDEISVLSKITSISNVYDNYCNHWDPEESLTPHEAVSQMFGRQSDRFDSELLSLFIRCLGIYPPATIVQLSNELIGIVVSISRDNRLRPSILIYDPDIPAKEALILDMEDDPEVTIVRSIRPSQLPPEVYTYLNPQVRISYFFESSGQGFLSTPPGH
jgi:putative nucleotidyltransferase with HDIG domain